MSILGALRKGKKLLLVPALALFLAMGMGVAAPRPAMAEGAPVHDALTWAKLVEIWNTLKEQLGIIGDILDIFEKINDFLNEILGKIEDAINAGSEAEVAAEQGLAETVTRAQQSANDVDTLNTRDAVAAKAAADRAPPPSGNHLCLSIYSKMALLGLHQFMDALTRGIADGAMMKGRGANRDAQGGTAIAESFAVRCGKAGTGGATMNPLDGGDCKAEEGRADIDINAGTWGTLDRPMQMPTVSISTAATKSGSVTVTMAPSNGSIEQDLFVGARNFCSEIIGARPTIYGPALKTASGRAAMAQFGHCAALQSGLVTQCARRVAYHTRPPCPDSSGPFSKLCEYISKACIAIAKQKVTLPDTMGCTESGSAYGLSLYEMEYASLATCFATDHYVGFLLGSGSFPMAMAVSDQCGLWFTTWQLEVTAQEAAFSSAMGALHTLSDCWSGYDNLKTIAMREVEQGKLAEKTDTAQPKQKVRAKKAEPAAPKAMPIGADHAADGGALLPAVFEQ